MWLTPTRRTASRRSPALTLVAVVGTVVVCVLGVGSQVDARAAEPQVNAAPVVPGQVRGTSARRGSGGSGSPAPSVPAEPTTTTAPPTTAPPPTTVPPPPPATTAPAPAVAEAQPAAGEPDAGDPPPPASAPEAAGAADFATAPGPAAVAAPGTSEPARTNEQRGEAVLSSLGVDVRALVPGWTIRFQGNDPGYRGSTFPHERVIEIYIRDDLSDGQIAHTLLHEVGHALDVDRLSDDGRQRWLAQRGRSGFAWWAHSGVSDYAVGSGDLAESFSFTLQGGGEWNSLLGPPPSPADQAVLRELLGIA